MYEEARPVFLRQKLQYRLRSLNFLIGMLVVSFKPMLFMLFVLPPMSNDEPAVSGLFKFELTGGSFNGLLVVCCCCCCCCDWAKSLLDIEYWRLIRLLLEPESIRVISMVDVKLPLLLLFSTMLFRMLFVLFA